MRSKLAVCVGLGLIVALLPLKASGEEKKPKQSYYETLQSLLGPKHLHVRPRGVPAGRDVNLIDPEKGALGVLFGESMDKVVGVWGKPHSLDVIGGMDWPWKLGIGAHGFAFKDNKLVGISVHSATSTDAHLKNGIGLKSSLEDVKKAFGEPTKKRATTLIYALPSGYSLEFHFVQEPDLRHNREGRVKLITISIFHPDAAR